MPAVANFMYVMTNELLVFIVITLTDVVPFQTGILLLFWDGSFMLGGYSKPLYRYKPDNKPRVARSHLFEFLGPWLRNCVLPIKSNLSNVFPRPVTLRRMEPLRFCKACPAPLGLPGYANLRVRGCYIEICFFAVPRLNFVTTQFRSFGHQEIFWLPVGQL